MDGSTGSGIGVAAGSSIRDRSSASSMRSGDQKMSDYGAALDECGNAAGQRSRCDVCAGVRWRRRTDGWRLGCGARSERAALRRGPLTTRFASSPGRDAESPPGASPVGTGVSSFLAPDGFSGVISRSVPTVASMSAAPLNAGSSTSTRTHFLEVGDRRRSNDPYSGV